MPTLRNSVNGRLAWPAVLAALGVRPVALTLPASSGCPLCGRGALTTYADATLGGVWLHCGGCAFAGDSLALAARAWRLDPLAAAARLVELGAATGPIDQGLVAAHAAWYAAWDEVARFWAACDLPGESHDSDETDRLLSRLGLAHFRVSHPYWRGRGGRIVGFSHRRAVDASFQPGTLAGRLERSPDGYRRTTVSGGCATFHGPGWDALVVVPFCDLPGRIAGFLFIGRGGDPATDYVYRRVPPLGSRGGRGVGSHGRGTRRRDGGLAFLSGLLARPYWLPADGEGERAAVIVSDVEPALRLQLRHLDDHDEPLPLVVPWEGPSYGPTTAWGALPPRRLVCWGRPDATLLARSRALGANVYPADPAEAVAGGSWPSSALRRALARAVPRERRLPLIERASSAEAAAAIAAAGLTPEQVTHLVAAGTPELRERVRAAPAIGSVEAVIAVGNRTVRETAEGRFTPPGRSSAT